MKKLSLFLLVLTLLPAALRAQSVTGYVDHAVVTQQVNQAGRKQANRLGKELVQAVEDEDTEKALSLIRRGANVNMVDRNGMTPLYKATIQNNIRLVEALLGANADPNTTRGNFSVLYQAVARGHVEIAKMLIDKGADVNKKNGYNHNTVLHVAAADGRLEMTNMLIDKGANIHALNEDRKTPFEVASPYVVETMFMKTGEGYRTYNFKNFNIYSTEFAQFAIEKRIRSLSGEIFDYIIRHRLDFNAKQMLQDLIAANMLPKDASVDAILYDAQDLKFFLDNGIKCKNMKERFISAVKNSEMDLVQLLIEKVDVNEKIYSEQAGNVFWFLSSDLNWIRRASGGYTGTVLGIAVRKGHQRMVDLLLAHGANPNIKNEDSGAFPLADAVLSGNRALVEKLLDANAEINAYNKTAYKISKDASEIVEALPEDRDYYVRVGVWHVKEEEQKRVPAGYALDYAVGRNDIKMAELLIGRGAKHLDSAMHMAGEKKNLEMIELLRKYGANVCAIKGTELEHTEIGYDLLKNCRRS